jgi:hypothetical protein
VLSIPVMHAPTNVDSREISDERCDGYEIWRQIEHTMCEKGKIAPSCDGSKQLAHSQAWKLKANPQNGIGTRQLVLVREQRIWEMPIFEMHASIVKS